VSTRAGPGAYALLTDGTTIEIRAARPEDFAAVRALHAKMSPDNRYLRFFSMSPAAAELEARRICREPGPDHAALLAVLDGEVVGDAQAPDGLARRAGGRDPGGRPPAGVPVWRLLQRPVGSGSRAATGSRSGIRRARAAWCRS